MSQPYNRETELKEGFNRFIADKITGSNNDYYSRLSVEDFEDIKTTLKDIHNILTYKTTIRFLDWLSDGFPFVKEKYQVYLDQVLNTKPSNNGYDLMVIGDIKIVAEIKCNKPINNGYVFGSNQKRGIIDDIKGLLTGKTKMKSLDPTEAYKFLVIYDFGDHTLSAAQHLIKNLPADLKDTVTIYEKDQPLTLDKVYIVFIK
ncbi:hypothetical protein [Thermicanus aegyptius]|uniref:hypothetical protein n=1 Tax=Thermicanus aegyptius TaxID=94009 RepID=UPI000408F565|nr:hypothetical protein [Thermicanus aegyptius]